VRLTTIQLMQLMQLIVLVPLVLLLPGETGHALSKCVHQQHAFNGSALHMSDPGDFQFTREL